MQFSFEKLFGMPAEDVKSVCILTPFLTKTFLTGLEITNRHTGNPYTCFDHQHFTLIQTRMGPLFTGDAILALNESPCETILFVGACGSLNDKDYPIGSVVAPVACHAVESFSHMVNNQVSLSSEIELSKKTTEHFDRKATPVVCASVGSILLEEQFKDQFCDNNIDVLDMECASVFSATKSINRNAAALLYVTDIIGETSPYEINDANAQQSIDQAQHQIIEIIKGLF